MARFVDRQWELHELDELANAPSAQFVVVYGQRRVDNTTLLLHWVQRAQRPYLYWVARRETAEATRQSLCPCPVALGLPGRARPDPTALRFLGIAL